MKIIELKQNSKDWYAWRGKGLGASDAPVVMGDSPWTTVFELWGQKTGLLPEKEASPFAIAAMRRGNELEPVARAWYIAKTGIVVEPVAAEHEQLQFLRASFDGYSREHQLVVEIKCPGKADHAKAVKGIVPDKYMPQIQQQLFIAGPDAVCDYVSFDGKEGVIIRVKPDPGYQSVLIAKMQEFWNLVESRTPPKVGSEDIARVMDSINEDLGKLNKRFQGLQVVVAALAAQSGGIGAWAEQQKLKGVENV